MSARHGYLLHRLIAFACGSALLAQAPAPVAPAVVARVGKQTISVRELAREVQAGADDDPGAFTAGDPRRAVLEVLIERKLLLEAALDAGYLEDPEIRRGLQGMLIQKYRQDHVDAALAKAVIPPAKVEEFYHSHREDYRLPPRRRAAVLQLSGAGDDALANARLVRTRAGQLATADFGPLAAEVSYDQATRYAGGDIGYLQPNQQYRWPAAVTAAAFALDKVGDVSEPIAADGSIWLVRLTENEEAAYRPLAEVAVPIRYELERKERARLLAELMAGLRATIGVEISDAALAAVPLPPVPSPPSLPGDRAP